MSRQRTFRSRQTYTRQRSSVTHDKDRRAQQVCVRDWDECTTRDVRLTKEVYRDRDFSVATYLDSEKKKKKYYPGIWDITGYSHIQVECVNTNKNLSFLTTLSDGESKDYKQHEKQVSQLIALAAITLVLEPNTNHQEVLEDVATDV